VSDERLAKS